MRHREFGRHVLADRLEGHAPWFGNPFDPRGGCTRVQLRSTAVVDRTSIHSAPVLAEDLRLGFHDRRFVNTGLGGARSMRRTAFLETHTHEMHPFLNCSDGGERCSAYGSGSRCWPHNRFGLRDGGVQFAMLHKVDLCFAADCEHLNFTRQGPVWFANIG
jgi:hypothetical protein